LYGFARLRDRSFADSPLDNPFNLQRHLVSRSTLRIFRSEAAAQWRSATIAA
jgi:putative transposase